MRHGQRAPLRTSLTPSYTRRGWSVVKGRSDIYTRPLPPYIPSEVTWFHGEIARLGTLLSLSPPPSSFAFSSFHPALFLSFIRTLFIGLSLFTFVYFIFPFLFLPSCFILFHFSLLHRLVYLHPPSVFPLRPFRV